MENAPSESGLAELVGMVRSWMPRCWAERRESRDFWMPDDSCRVCYECDVLFTLFNRKHHCRLCGRVFCNRCTANSVPASALGPCRRRGRWRDADGERIRVCNFCYKQWHQEMEISAMAAAMVDSELRCSSPTSGLSRSPSATSLASSKSSGTANSNSTVGGPFLFSTRTYQHANHTAGHGALLPVALMDLPDEHDVQRNNVDPAADVGVPSPIPYGYCLGRSDDEDDDYGACHSDSDGQCFQAFHQSNASYNPVEFDDVDCDQPAEGKICANEFCSLVDETADHRSLLGIEGAEAELDNSYDCDASSAVNTEEADAEPVDFENNGVLWFPPSPENDEDEKDAIIFNEEEDDDATLEFRYLRTSGSFDFGESRNRERTVEEHRKAMKNVLDGHFKALVSQLLQVENLPEGEEGDKESWLEIVTSLSWEVASLLKPDTSKGGGMDPGGYAKIKCIASGRRSDSCVLRGVVCRKNLAHRRMKSMIEKPRLLILGGALEYQRVSNLLSSFDTLLQQEMDHLKMAVAKIDAQHPDLLLVEKTVSRFAQDYLLAKNISLVLNIKRPLLQRIAWCTGAQIIPSIDHLSSQKLGCCGLFYVQKFVEEHGIAANGGNKPTKNLMFFEGCPKPFGCTVLLRGADRDELKRVKHVVQYAVFAAYHLALETSFLANEGASLPELPLRSPITVALPEKASASAIGRSISTVSGFTVYNANAMQNGNRVNISDNNGMPQCSSGLSSALVSKLFAEPEGLQKNRFLSAPLSAACSPGNLDEYNPTCHSVWKKHREDILRYFRERNSGMDIEYSAVCNLLRNNDEDMDISAPYGKTSEALLIGDKLDTVKQPYHSEFGKFLKDNDNGNTNQEEEQISGDAFPPSPSDHQSILVSLSTRCVWKGTVCERAHLFRIKYYGSFDKPLGRFLRDDLFDQGFCCCFCDMPSEAHVHCYTHRQGSLTISVKKLPEFLLPGEREGKIWMWHRCLKCPRRGGMPPETRRVVMSDAAWGLSFGKFLELSFSNHAAASRVASCGHSLHRDCLRFYGFDKMVACFRYASIDVNSVYLPPAQLDFNIQNADWIQNEVNEVVEKADLLFTEVLNGINQVSKRMSSISPNGHLKVQDSKFCSVDLRGIWQKEKADFEESLEKISGSCLKKGQPDIIEINKLHRKLLFHAYLWDRRLLFAAGFDNSSEWLGNVAVNKEKLVSVEGPVETNSLLKPQNAFNNLDSCLADNRRDMIHNGSMLPSNAEGECPAQSNLGSPNHWEGELPKNTGESQLCNSHMMNDSLRKDPLQPDGVLRRALSDGGAPLAQNLSDTLDAKWTGEDGNPLDLSKSDRLDVFDDKNVTPELQDSVDTYSELDLVRYFSGTPAGREGAKRDLSRWVDMPFSTFYSAINKGYAGDTLFHILQEYNPVYISSFKEINRQGGARVLLPLGIDENFVPIFDEEPASIICHALVSPKYHSQMDEERDRTKDGCDSTSSLPSYDSGSSSYPASFDEMPESLRSVGSLDDSMLLMLAGSALPSDPSPYSKNLHIKVSFSDECSSGKMKYSVTCYYAKHFQSLRRICCPSELDFVKSLSRCKKWGAQGGKSNVFFAKSLDDRFIVKQVTKTELESFLLFAPRYFTYLSDSVRTRSPTCLAKILGIYQVSSKNMKGGKESKMDVLVMENLLYGRNISRLYDLKGSSRSRYNADSSGNNKVLLDQNLIESMPTSPIFVGNKAKRLLERAVWNDTSFLASIDVMDYSLLVGIDEERHELVLGIIDFMRQYTWDKHLETWVKASGILGGPKNADPTVISPKQYKKRFRKAMTAYFLMVPDQWTPPSIAPSASQSDLGEEV